MKRKSNLINQLFMKFKTMILKNQHNNAGLYNSALMLCLMLSLSVLSLQAQTVTSLSALQTAINNASPGAVITLANGTYTASTDIVITKQGTATAPITIQAQTIGGATIGGTNGFSINSPAAYIVIKGFRFTHTASQATMTSGTHHCRWTRNLFQTPGDGDNLSLNGNDHEIDFNTFQNKNAMGRFIAVRGSGSQIAQRLWIHHNYFFNHDPQTANGAESLQFGLSGYSLSSSNSIVEYNLFEQLEGENEAISIKASAVTLRYNTFRDGTQLTLRHGNFCNVYGNYFLNSEGIRFFGDDHKIYSNHIESCSPGIQIGNGGGEVADGAPLTSHDRPDRCLVAFNTLVNNASNITQSGRTDGLGATSITISNNIVQGGGPAATIAGPLTSSTWTGNIIWQTNGDGDMPTSGYRNVNPLLGRDATGTFHLQSGSPAIGTATSSPSSVNVDMDGQGRGSAPYDVGADEVSSAAVTVQFLTSAMVGQNGSTTSPQPPAAPTGLTASAVSASQINLTWTDNSNNESNFQVERSTNGGTTWTSLVTLGANTNTYSNTGLSAGTTYHYRVRATNAVGSSAFSNTANATTQQTPIQPTYQAESATISQGVIESNHAGFNGTGFVNYDNVAGSYVEWRINVSSAGTYNLAIRYANFSGADRPMSISVNGSTTHSNLSFPVTAAWTDYKTVAFTASLNAGVNTLRATATTATGGPNVDELQVNGLVATLQNVALGKSVTASGSDTNIPANAVDGDNVTRWSASPMPQWLEVDLGAIFQISKTEVVSYADRAYQFLVEVKTTSSGTYATVVDRRTNTTPGTITAPITNSFSAVNARYIRITVTGASGYTGTWASIAEFRVFGVPGGAGGSSEEVESETNFNDDDVKNYPNPTSGKVTLQFSLASESDVAVTLYNTMTQNTTRVFSKKLPAGKHNEIIDVSHFPKGLHIIRLLRGNKVTTYKLIRQ
jgi:poly(beta-D-mannuronate) lyase